MGGLPMGARLVERQRQVKRYTSPERTEPPFRYARGEVRRGIAVFGRDPATS